MKLYSCIISVSPLEGRKTFKQVNKSLAGGIQGVYQSCFAGNEHIWRLMRAAQTKPFTQSHMVEPEDALISVKILI